MLKRNKFLKAPEDQDGLLNQKAKEYRIKSQLTPCHTAAFGNFQTFNCNERLQARIPSNISQCFKHPREVH